MLLLSVALLYLVIFRLRMMPVFSLSTDLFVLFLNV